ncbi:MAG: CHAT domain-containing protein [Saprospiraceae bacterium]|nr:CHAT domain-containing protein [Saprospiraceae bacterium]
MRTTLRYLTAFIVPFLRGRSVLLATGLAFLLVSSEPAATFSTSPEISFADDVFRQGEQLRIGLQYDSAMQQFALAAAAYKASGLWPKYIATKQREALCLWAAHRSEDAAALCRDALSEAACLLPPEAIERAGLYTVLGNIHADRRTLRDFCVADVYFSNALELTLRHYRPPHGAIAEAYERRGIARRLIDDYEAAMPWYEKALTALPPPDKNNIEAHLRVCNNLGLLYESLGDQNKALTYYRNACHLRLQWLGLKDGRYAKHLKNIGRTQLAQGNAADALLTLHEALAIEQQAGEANSLNKVFITEAIGDCYRALGNLPLARVQYEQFLQYWNPAIRDHINGRLIGLQKTGRVWLEMGRPECASVYFEDAYALIDTIMDAGSFNRVQPLLYLGQACAQTGALQLAARHYGQALHIAQTTVGATHPATRLCHYYLAEWYAQQGRYAEALHHTGQALTPLSDAADLQIEDLTVFRLKIALLMERPAAENKLAALQEAVETGLAGLAVGDALKTQLHSPAAIARLQEMVAALAEDALAATWQWWQYNGDEAALYAAFTFFEKSKSASLLPALRQEEAMQRSGIPAKLVEEERRLRAQLEQLQQSLYGTAITIEVTDEILTLRQARSFELRRQLAAVCHRIAEAYPEYYREKYDYEVTDLAAVKIVAQRRNTVVASFFWGDSAVYILTVLPDKVLFQRMEPDAPALHIEGITRLLHDYRPGWHGDQEQLADFDAFAEHAHTLYRMLLQPALPPGDQRPLVVIPDGLLHQVPFHLLLDRPLAPEQVLDYRRLPYLLRNHRIRTAFSATLLADEEPLEPGQSIAYLGFAPAVREAGAKEEPPAFALRQNAGPGYLPHAAEEVREAAKLFRGRYFAGSRATETLFKETAHTAGILHLATHTCTQTKSPGYTALLFSPSTNGADNSLLNVYEIYNLHVPADLVVISGCAAEAGAWQRGEGAVNLSRAFRYAGSPAVVTTLWPAHDAGGKDFITGFFRHLAKGAEKSAAMQQAALDYLADVKQDERAHPFYWGNFVCIGNDGAVRR